jgi:tetratricopeptide (TPR) repeat protein
MEADLKAFSAQMDEVENSAAKDSFSQKVNDLIGKAKDLMNARDFKGAIKALDEAIKLQPDNANLYLMRAMAKNMDGDFVGAEKDARKAIELDPNNDQAWENLAWALLKQGKYAEALEAAEQALKLNPKNALALSIRAFAKEKLGDKQGAQKDIEAAASMDKRMRSFMQRGLKGQPIFDARMDFLSLHSGKDAYGEEEGGASGSPLALPMALLGLSAVFGAALFDYLLASKKGRVRSLKDYPKYLINRFRA